MKTPFRYHDQLELLQSRGLCVEDTERATFYLKNIGYYRLSGYLKNFQKRDRNEFFSETTFEKVLKLYVFDRKLRLLFLDAIERIEVSFRAIVSDTLCFETGDAHWFLRKENYFFYEKENWSHNDQFEKIQNILQKALLESKETFIKDHKERNGEDLPESWKLFNILSFGQVSFLFTHLKRDHKKSIAKAYSIKAKTLQSWMIALSYVRNICAHHSRLWNKKFDKQFQVPNLYKKEGLENNKVFFALFAVLVLLKSVSPHSTWKMETEKLLTEYSDISKEQMGFPTDWELLFAKI